MYVPFLPKMDQSTKFGIGNRLGREHCSRYVNENVKLGIVPLWVSIKGASNYVLKMGQSHYCHAIWVKIQNGHHQHVPFTMVHDHELSTMLGILG